MSKEKFKVVEELDPASVTGISELQRNHYLALGYKPFLMSNGRVKWLTEANRVYRTARTTHHIPLMPVTHKSRQNGRKKHRRTSPVLVFLKENWLFILIILAILAVIVFVMR